MRLALSSRSLTEGDVAAAIQRAAGLGIEGIEVWLDDVWQAGEIPRQVAALVREAGLSLSAYAPSLAQNIISPDAEERERSMRWAVEAVALTRRLGADILTLEPGYLVSGRQGLHNGWRPFLSAARTLAKAAEQQGVRIGFQNASPAGDDMLAQLVDAQSLLREVDSPCLGITLNLSRLAGSTEDAVDWAGGIERLVQIRVSQDRPRRTIPPLLGNSQQRALFFDRLEAAGFSGFFVLDDPHLPAAAERIPDVTAQLRRWSIIRRPSHHRRPSAVRRSGTHG